ncbi:MAG: hypothetical protein O7F17_00950 [Planctomycetota bacterium]|nr:hypothetical protein [Planctomycetota bacterium]
MSEELELSLPTVSHSLGLLRKRALVEFKQIKPTRIYRLNDRVRGSARSKFVRLKILTGAGEQVSILLRSDRWSNEP